MDLPNKKAEIEITPEMIEAGMGVFRDWLEDPGDHYLTDDLVCDIHRAMRTAGREPHSGGKQTGHD